MIELFENEASLPATKTDREEMAAWRLTRRFPKGSLWDKPTEWAWEQFTWRVKF